MQVFHLSPLIRLTLLALYGSLTLPLPLLAQATAAPVSPNVLSSAILIGAVLLYGVLAERVEVNEAEIRVCYPRWLPKRGWQLAWSEIAAIRDRSTGQGGLVYYFVTQTGEARLLPLRIAGWRQLLQIIVERSGVDTLGIRPLAQPWMYLVLLGCTVLLLLMDLWVVTTALSLAA